MEVTITITRNRVALVGLGSLILIAAIFMLPNLLAARLSADRAETELRAYLMGQLTQQQVEQLQSAGVSAPDSVLARRWQVDTARSQQVTIGLLEVRRFLFTPPLASSRLYMVRAELTYPGEAMETRYYAMSSEHRLVDFYWVDEKPAWFWWLAK